MQVGDLAIALPGSASKGDFVKRAFATLIGPADVAVVTDPSGDASSIATRLTSTVATHKPQLIIGVSIGAHAAAEWAADEPRWPDCPLVLCMPAWSGAPSDVAMATALAARRLRRSGIAAELDSLARDYPDDWVVKELDSAWRDRDRDELVTTLNGTAGSAAPTLHDLANIANPTAVVALADDPLHPLSVAQDWTRAIPRAVLAVVERHAPSADIGVFGDLAAEALERSISEFR